MRRDGGNRRGIVVGLAVVAFLLGSLVTLLARRALFPSPAEQTARAFLAAWSNGDYRQTYAYLATSIGAEEFVDALSHTAAPVRDLRVEGVVQENDRQAVVAYSGAVPEPVDAASAIVLANRFRYPDACTAALDQRLRFRRIDDTLHLERDPTGAWKVGLRGETDFSQEGARLLALAFDLAPRFIWGHLSASLDPRDDRYDDRVILEALNVYADDLGSDAAAGDPTAWVREVHALLNQLTPSCKA